MPGEGESEETDIFQTIHCNQQKEVELERKRGLAMAGGKLKDPVIFPIIVVVCIEMKENNEIFDGGNSPANQIC